MCGIPSRRNLVQNIDPGRRHLPTCHLKEVCIWRYSADSRHTRWYLSRDRDGLLQLWCRKEDVEGDLQDGR